MCTIQLKRIVHTTAFINPAVEYWLVRMFNDTTEQTGTWRGTFTTSYYFLLHIVVVFVLGEGEVLVSPSPPPPPPPIFNTSSFCLFMSLNCFIFCLSFFSFHILGNAGLCLGYEFYTAPNLAQYLLESIFNCVQNMPDYRFRPIIHILCYNQFITAEYWDYFCNFMFCFRHISILG